jgi:tetratricopeptide (TPR) repeat protein
MANDKKIPDGPGSEAFGSHENQETVRLKSLARGVAFGRYKIGRRIGSGGMGTVYTAFDPTLDRQIALKVLHDKVENAEAEQRLLREAQAMARLSHPNVVTVHDAGTQDGRPYVAMEYVEGCDLGAWLNSEERGWREIVGQLVAAGEGLAAAHAAGLVHRDFKPGNVLVGNDGRARVTDFGLARAAAADDWQSMTQTTELVEPSTDGSDSTSPLDTPLTQEGAVLGTLAFMAPEQALQGLADHRSDQYAFCVSSYVALFGGHPLGSFRDFSDYAARLQSQDAGPPPAGHRVPARIVDAIMKGLSRQPEDRHPDMEALLDELRPETVPGKKRWLVAAAGIAAAALVIGIIALATYRRQLCAGGEDHVAAVWDNDRRQRLEAHFVRVVDEVGIEIAAAVATQLDDYTGRWATIHRDACVSTRIRGEHSEALLDRQMACLRRQLRQTDHLLALFEAGGREVAASALGAVLGLDGPEVCSDSNALVERVPLPEDESTRTALEDLDDRLAAANADKLAGDYATALERLETIVPEARELGYAPTIAEALTLKGFVESELRMAEEAVSSLREAFGAAEQGRDDRQGAIAASNLMWVEGYLRRQFDEAERWSDLTLAKIERLGGDEPVAAEYLDSRAGVLMQAGRQREALEVQKQAVELNSKISGPESLDTAMAMNTMGHALSNVGDFETAIESYDRSLEIKQSHVGPDHPTLGYTLASRSQAYASINDYERAAEDARRAIVIFEKSFGSDAPQLATPLNNLAYSLEGLGQFDEAREMHARSMEVVENAWGPDHPQIAYSLLNLSSLEKQAGDYQAALEASSRAGEILTAAYGTEHPLYAYAANNTGVFLMETGQAAQGVVHLEKALEIRIAAQTDPVLIGVTRFNLGRAQWQAGQRDLGRRSVLEAERELVDAGAQGEEDLEAARAWLAEHPAG